MNIDNSIDNSIKRFVLPSSHGPMGISLISEEIALVVKVMDENPEKYPEGAEGVLEALSEIRKYGADTSK